MGHGEGSLGMAATWPPLFVMPGLDPGIHLPVAARPLGSSPGATGMSHGAKEL
jgi:hypothetical protein